MLILWAVRLFCEPKVPFQMQVGHETKSDFIQLLSDLFVIKTVIIFIICL